jgi:hypothetical protein
VQPLAQVRAAPLAHVDTDTEVMLVWFRPDHPAAPAPAARGELKGGNPAMQPQPAPPKSSATPQPAPPPPPAPGSEPSGALPTQTTAAAHGTAAPKRAERSQGVPAAGAPASGAPAAGAPASGAPAAEAPAAEAPASGAPGAGATAAAAAVPGQEQP